jgi:hypothetical protein
MRKIAAIALPLAISAVLFTGIGVTVGLSLKPRPAPPAPAIADCGNSADEIAARNIVWRVLNKDTQDLAISPETLLGTGLALLLDPKTTPEQRSSLPLGIMAKKGLVFMPTEDRDVLGKALAAEGWDAERTAMLLQLVDADVRAGKLVMCVLHDSDRVQLFLGGKKIPLEAPQN